jgi:hypothetical protein
MNICNISVNHLSIVVRIALALGWVQMTSVERALSARWDTKLATISARKARVAVVFIHHSAKMDVEESVCVWVLYRRMKRRRQRYRKYWVHPILRNRLTTSLYVTLYPSLRNYEPKFFNYFRMSNLLITCWNSLRKKLRPIQMQSYVFQGAR